MSSVIRFGRTMLIVSLILGGAVSATAQVPQNRVWKTRAGRSYKAKIAGMGKGRVILRLHPTGVTRAVGFSALSDEDQAYLLPHYGKIDEPTGPAVEPPPKPPSLRYRDWRLTDGRVIKAAAFVRIVGHYVMLVRTAALEKIPPIPRRLLSSQDRAVVQQLWSQRLRLYDETIWQFKDGASIPNTRFEKRANNQLRLLRYGTKPIVADIRKLDYTDQVYVSLEDSGVYSGIEGRHLVPREYKPYDDAFQQLELSATHNGAYRFFVRDREQDSHELSLLVSEYASKTRELPTSELVHLGNYSAAVGGAASHPFLFKGKLIKPRSSTRTVGLAEFDYRTCRPSAAGVELETRFGERFQLPMRQDADVDRTQVYAAIESLAVRDMFLRRLHFHQLDGPQRIVDHSDGALSEGDFLFSKTWKDLNRTLVARGERNYDGSQRRPNGAPAESDDWLRILRGRSDIRGRLEERRERQNFEDFLELLIRAFERYQDRDDLREKIKEEGLAKTLYDDWRENPENPWTKVDIAQRAIVLFEIEIERKKKEKDKDYEERRLSDVLGVLDAFHAALQLCRPTWDQYDEDLLRFATSDLLALAKLELESSKEPGRVAVQMVGEDTVQLGGSIKLRLNADAHEKISRPLPDGGLIGELLEREVQIEIAGGFGSNEIVFDKSARRSRDRLFTILEHLIERQLERPGMAAYTHSFESEVTKRLKADVETLGFEFPRIWRKKDSRDRITAKLVDILGDGAVVLQGESGKRNKLPIDFFSTEDQHYVRFVSSQTTNEVRGWKRAQLYGLRQWKSRDGKNSVIGAFVAYDYRGAELWLPEKAKIINFPLKFLSHEDVKFLFDNFAMDARGVGLIPTHVPEEP